MCNIEQIAEKADMIINGYAFTKADAGYRILNLNRPDKALVLSIDGDILETTMDDIEISIAKNYLEKNKELMED